MSQPFLARPKSGLLGFAVLSLALLVLAPAYAGQTIYGTVTSVKSANTMTLDYGAGHYEIRVVGIQAPAEGRTAVAARTFVAGLVLGKKARLWFYARGPNGEMTGRLMTDDRVIGFKDVALELVRAGIVQRQKNFDYRNGELSRAEKEAQGAHRGLWSTPRPQ